MVAIRREGVAVGAGRVECSECKALMQPDFYALCFGRCPKHDDAEQARERGRDVCDICASVRVEDDDDGHAGEASPKARPKPRGSGVCWVRIGDRRVCGACVHQTLTSRFSRPGWAP